MRIKDINKIKNMNERSLQFSSTLKLILFVVSLVCFLFIFNNVNLSRYFPIKNVQVHGVKHLDTIEMQKMILPLVSDGFFNLNVAKIKDRLLALPWIAEIFVRRNWPDRLEITVVEKKPIALWNDSSLLSEAGELFTPQKDTYPQGLPNLIGPLGQQMIMLQYLKDINRTISPLRVKISALEFSPYLTWKLKLANGISIQLGNKDILTRLAHFVKVYAKIVGTQVANIDYIDLRYANGVAVRMKQNKIPIQVERG